MSQAAIPQVSEDSITAQALEAYNKTPDPRLREIMTALVKSLHAFVREVRLTEQEWFRAIDFLTRTGQICTDHRQEFILLSDIMGISMLVDLITHQKPAGATESTVLGPFYAHDAPELPFGGNIAPKDPAMPLFFSGRILDTEGRPVKGAWIDAWQTGSDGLYDVQRPDRVEAHMRGRVPADDQGRYRLRTVRPVSYPVPVDGPVGEIMRSCRRQPKRPAHTHFMITAPGYETLITHLFDPDDPHLDCDPVFAVKKSLIYEIQRHETPQPGYDVDPPFYTVERDFVLTRASGNASGGPAWGAR